MAAPKAKFFQKNAAPMGPPSLAQIGWAVFCEVRAVLIAFVAVTIASALIYYWTGSIEPTFAYTSPFQLRFGDCLHFSVVTIATLGYGDFRPVGIARAVSAAEVIVGVVLMGVFIAKLVSQRQERLTKRLVRGQLNIEIQDFRELLADIERDFRIAIRTSAQAITTALYRASGISKAIARYWRSEATAPDLNMIVPVGASGRLLGDLLNLLELIDAWVGNQPANAFSPRDRVYIRNTCEGTLVMAEVLVQRLNTGGFAHSRARALDVVSRLRAKLNLGEKIIVI